MTGIGARAAPGDAGSGQQVRRYAVIGDVGGHLVDLRRELVRLGADPDTGRLPEDLTVIQVGDLVHRGPDSAGVVALVDRVLREQPDRWVQLVGNHETRYLDAPSFAWPERLDDRTVATLRSWWDERLFRVAAVVPLLDGGEALVTHAGLTSGFWRGVLGAPPTANQTAAALNALIGAGSDELFRAGQLLLGGGPDPAAGPLWAVAATELVPSWLGAGSGFSQIHGHTSLYAWDDRRFQVREEIARRTTVDEQARHEVTKLGGTVIIGVDPCHGVRPASSWRAWEHAAVAGS